MIRVATSAALLDLRDLYVFLPLFSLFKPNCLLEVKLEGQDEGTFFGCCFFSLSEQ